MELPENSRRTLVCHASEDAFAEWTCPIMKRLGYAMLTPEEFEELAAASEDLVRADLRIVDERNLGEVPEDGGVAAPLIVITGRHGVTGVDPRIAGALKRPVGLHEFHCLVQRLLEEQPRSVPRVPTHLRARCRREGKEWSASVLSLSENGCLLRSPEPMALGSSLALSFTLPRTGTIEIEADAAYQLVPDFGLIFSATPPGTRSAIACYVRDQLLAEP